MISLVPYPLSSDGSDSEEKEKVQEEKEKKEAEKEEELPTSSLPSFTDMYNTVEIPTYLKRVRTVCCGC